MVASCAALNVVPEVDGEDVGDEDVDAGEDDELEVDEVALAATDEGVVDAPVPPSWVTVIVNWFPLGPCPVSILMSYWDPFPDC
jgi:hypothetical protein